MTAPGHSRRLRGAARRLADDLRRPHCLLDDDAFDRFLPAPLQAVSDQYWSPLAVAKRAADWFDEAGIRRVVDVGSGAGKFCTAAAIFGQCEFIGLEQRRFLVGAARSLARVFAVQDRVRFVPGAFGATPLPGVDAYYMFNPFGQYRFASHKVADTDVPFSHHQRTRDIAVAEQLLRQVPEGTWLLTYNGFGGRVPDGYRPIHDDWKLRSPLRLWRKEHNK
jgi:SAM-dependent methyltransferase